MKDEQGSAGQRDLEAEGAVCSEASNTKKQKIGWRNVLVTPYSGALPWWHSSMCPAVSYNALGSSSPHLCSRGSIH